MLSFLPFLTWLAAITSGVLIAFLWEMGELRRAHLAVVLAWFVLAAYAQFLGRSPVVSAVGAAFQTVLAIYLMLRWRLGA